MSNMLYKLKECLERTGLGGRIAGIETADKVTGGQIAAKTRKHFPASVPVAGRGPRRAPFLLLIYR